ncbi:MAG: transcription termination/antitermination protein NusA [Candidatus Yanofskybacteria bacterium]|nr:transcription termination/antitermination protein NusA [Candidatus Yanofskybacteria bacterium]
MLDTKQFISAIKQIAEEKGIPEDKVVETIEAAIAAAYKRDYGEKGQIIKAKLNQETGDVKITQTKYVVEGVDEEGNVIGDVPDRPLEGIVGLQKPVEIREVGEEKKTAKFKKEEGEAVETGNEEDGKVKFNSEKYLTLEEAKKINKKIKVGEEVVIERESKTEFGRIAAQTAKQVIIQRLREVEREAIFAEFKKKENEVISGVVQRVEGNMIYIDLGRTTGLLIPAEQLYQEHYRIGQRLRFLILRVEETHRGPVILLSRSHPKLVLKLFEFEVPEIDAGSVEIKAIAREAGSRSKIAVISTEEGVDPIGSLVGQKGVRVQTVINELGGEKIDIIEWNENPTKFISNALSPAKIIDVKILDEARHHALAEVADDQFSLAIGKKGQNVRLAAKLTGWKIDVRAPQAKMTAEEIFTEETQSGKEAQKVEVLNLEEKGTTEEGKEAKTAENKEEPGKEEKPKKKTKNKKAEAIKEVEPLT